MKKIFNRCVNLLVYIARLLSITYEQLNVIIFVIIQPILFIIMTILIILLCKYK